MVEVKPIPDDYPRVMPYLSVENASAAIEFYSAVFDWAIAAGATVEREVQDQFYGDRAGQFVDPSGHKWFVATHVEDVAPQDLEQRAAAAMGG